MTGLQGTQATESDQVLGQLIVSVCTGVNCVLGYR